MDFKKTFKRVLLLAHSAAFFYVGHKIISTVVDNRRHIRILWTSAGIAVHLIGVHLLREAYFLRVPSLPQNPVNEPAIEPPPNDPPHPPNPEDRPVFGPIPDPGLPVPIIPNGQAYRIPPYPNEPDNLEIVNDLIVLPLAQPQNEAN